MKKLIPFILLLVLVNVAYALELSDGSMVGFWDLDDAGAIMTDRKSNSLNQSDLNYNGALQQQAALAPNSDFSLGFDGTDDRAINTSTDLLSQINKAINYTVNCWVDSDGNDDDTIFSTRGGSNGGIYIRATADGGGTIGYGTDADVTYVTGSAISGMVTARYNATSGKCTLYLDGVNVSENNCNGDNGDAEEVSIGLKNGGIPFAGDIDDCFYIKRALSQGEITDVYNNGVGGAAAGKPVAPTIIAPSPADNSHNNTNVSLNVSHSTTNNDVNYYLYLGVGTDLKENNLTVNNATRDGDEWKGYITELSDGTYYWKWRVQNTTDGEFSANTTVRTLYIDTVTPTITLNGNNTFKTDNSTIISGYINDFAFNVSFFDTYLYQILINITNSTGGSIFDFTNTTMGGKKTCNLSRNINVSDNPIGNYIISFSATDSHTLNNIDDYEVISGLNYFRYDTKEDNMIRIESDTLPSSKKTTKLKDRYNFEFNYLLNQDTYIFRVMSYNKIDYLPNSEYPAHFVILSDKGGNWVDFGGISKKDIKVTKIDDYEYEVEITSNGEKSFLFNSIGGLNQIEKDYLFKLGAVVDVWADDETDNTELNATITSGSQVAHTINKPAILYNITKDITSFQLNASGFGTETHNVDITLNYHNFTFNMTPVNAVKVYFYDENSESLIRGETMSVYLETTGFSNTYSADTDTDNPYTITGLDGGIYDLEASSANYPEREYFDLNVSNVSTTNINVYLVNSTEGAEITFEIKDESQDELNGVNAEIMRIINGTETIVAEEKSDFAGRFKLYMDENYEYTINLSKSGFLSKSITLEPSELDSPYTIIMYTGIVLIPIPNIELMISQLNITLTRSNVLKQWNLTWREVIPPLTKLRFTVTQHNVTNDTIILKYLNSTSSGNYTYNLPPPYNNTDGIYVGSVYGIYGADTYYITSLSIDIRSEWDTFKTESLFVSFLFIGTMMCIGIFFSAEAALALTLVGMFVFWRLGFYSISMTGILSLMVLIIIIIIKVKK